MNSAARPANLDWTALRSFGAVIEHGSLLAAARWLGSSQPTVGRHVAALERQLGVLLFERTGRALVPTRAALAISEQARAMATGAEAIARALAGQSAAATGRVRITASQVVAFALLPPLLARLRRAEPGIALEVVASNGIANLLRREADIALRMARPRQSTLLTRKVGELAVGAFGQRDYLRRRGVPRAPAELLQHELVGYDRDETLLRGFAALGHPIERERFAFRTDDHLVYWQAVRAGLGIGFGAVFHAEGDPLLQRVLPQLPIPPLPVWLTVHREIRTSPRIRAVYDFLAEAVPGALRS